MEEAKPPHVGGEGQEVKARLLRVGGGEGGHEASPAQSGKPRRLLPASVGEEGGHGAEGLHLVEGPGPGVLGEEEGGGEEGPVLPPGVPPVNPGPRLQEGRHRFFHLRLLLQGGQRPEVHALLPGVAEP